ncbi:MAG: GNAT family N-acetyltransferase [Methanoregula sp.]|nr:GNAT family N-acetyltransferase [Methanoregula sp.]
MPLSELHFSPISRGSDLSTFSCGHADLDEFLIEDSMEYQQERLSVTRLAYSNSEIVGFFTLVADCIDAKQVAPEDGRQGYPYRKYPAIKIARLGTSKKHQRNGVGSRMLREILALTIMISEYVGCRIITVDAKPGSVGFYEKFGFKRAMSRRSDPVPMYMDYHRLLEEVPPTG